jgi:superfamily II DNA helicase RecQ
MKYRFFTIPAHAPEETQETLNSFCAQHRVAAVEKQFVADGHGSFWSICVSYLEQDNKSAVPRRSKIDYRELLNEQDFAMFAKLRALRKSLAEQEGIPAYALFTNEQLAAMVRQRITSSSALGAIEGIGKSRIEKYGKAFIAILSEELSGNSSNAKKTPEHETDQN